MIKIESLENGKIALLTPYNPEFVTRIKATGARWDANSKAWQIDAANIDVARKIMREVYGQDDQATVGDLVDVRVTIKERIIAECSPLYLFGKMVASAFSRDSGAKVAEDVCFETGMPRSAGSAKNWITVIDEGSVFTIRKVAKDMIDFNNSNYDVEVL